MEIAAAAAAVAVAAGAAAATTTTTATAATKESLHHFTKTAKPAEICSMLLQCKKVFEL